MSRIGLLFLALSVPGGSWAAETLTPERAVQIAVSHHPGIRAADREVDSASAGRDVAGSGYLPRIEVTEDFVRSTNPTFVFASKLGQEIFSEADFDPALLNNPAPLNNSALRVALRQSVWDAGRTHLHKQAAGLGIEEATSARSRVRDEIAFGAVRAFWDAVLAGKMLEVARAGEEAAQAAVDLAREQVDAGLAVPSDRMQAEVRLAEVRALRIRAEQGERVARAALRQALGVAEEVEYLLEPPPVEPSEEDEADLEAQVPAALMSRADLQSLDARRQQAELGEKIARSGYLPEIGVGGQYEMNADTPFGADGSNWSIGATLRIPVYQGGETSARRARARADLARVEAYREALAEEVRFQVLSAAAERRGAAERLRAATSALALADEALRIVRERYQAGMAVMVELIGAEAARTSAQGNRVQAARDLAVSRAAHDLASGTPLAEPTR